MFPRCRFRGIFPPLPSNASSAGGGKIAPRGRGANIPALQLVVLLLSVPLANAVQYRDVIFTAGINSVPALPEGSAVPVRYTIENRAAAQEIQVVLQTGERKYTRTHQVAAGEKVTGFFYVPTTKQSYGMYCQMHFVGSRSGTLPRERWESVHHSYNYNARELSYPRVLLVGAGFDLTGLDAALSAGTPSSPPARDLYAQVPVTDLPTSWVGLGGVSVVLMGQEEAGRASAEVKAALQDYVFSGGVLLLATRDAAWCRQWWGKNGATHDVAGRMEVDFGLGSVTQLAREPQGSSDWSQLFAKLRNWPSKTGKGREEMLRRDKEKAVAWWSIFRELEALGIERPEFPKISYGLLWWLMAAFAIVVGPVNYGILKKRGQLALFMITAPAISVVAGLSLLGTFTLLEGRQSKAVTSGVTFLFQGDHRAITFQRVSVYSPSSLALSFPAHTLVQTHFGGEFQSEQAYRHHVVEQEGGTIDCTSGFTLDRNFVPPRLVRAFGAAQVRPERGRMLVEQAGGSYRAQNGLGVNLTSFVYRDAEGRYFEAETIRSGETVTLKPAKQMITGGVKTPGQYRMPRGSYVATTSDAYGLPKLNARLGMKQTKHTICGVME
jgi:hypothetical protein